MLITQDLSTESLQLEEDELITDEDLRIALDEVEFDQMFLVELGEPEQEDVESAKRKHDLEHQLKKLTE